MVSHRWRGPFFPFHDPNRAHTQLQWAVWVGGKGFDSLARRAPLSTTARWRSSPPVRAVRVVPLQREKGRGGRAGPP